MEIVNLHRSLILHIFHYIRSLLMKTLLRLCFPIDCKPQFSNENEYSPPIIWSDEDFSEAAKLLRVTSILNQFIKYRNNTEPVSPAHRLNVGSYQKGRDEKKDTKLKNDYQYLISNGIDYLFQKNSSIFESKNKFLQYLKSILKKDIDEINFFTHFILTIYDEETETRCPAQYVLKRKRPEKIGDMKDDVDQIINLALIQNKITKLLAKSFSSKQEFHNLIDRINIRALLVEGGISSISVLMEKVSKNLEKKAINDDDDEINQEARLIIKNPPTALRGPLAKKRICICWNDMRRQCTSLLSHPLFVGVASAFLGGIVTYYCTPQNSKTCPEYCRSDSSTDYFTFFSIKEELCNISTTVLENWCNQNCTGLKS
jgi:hypothetical protein